jgi:acetate kinase
MDVLEKNILTINGGSSSIKFAVYTANEKPIRLFSGEIERIGLEKPHLSFLDNRSSPEEKKEFNSLGLQDAVTELISLLDSRKQLENLAAIGHRLVHGMEFTEPQIITDSLLAELQDISSYDPDHLPGEIELINALRKKLPKLLQVACFDTSFHTTIPRLARILPIPRRYDRQGIRKYGFHGLSYAYIMEELRRLGEPSVYTGRMILAHLGNGASMAAIKDGLCVDTSMGFTPVGGLVMGTRTGDLDPGLVAVIMNQEKMNAGSFNDFVNHACGLLGVSETSSDMQDLLEKESSDIRAAEAVNLFCYQAKKWIGSFMAVLGGLDVLVFTGGIGEHAAAIRQRICEGLEYTGIEIDLKSNEQGINIISSSTGKVVVYVIATNEEFMIAKLVSNVLQNKKP